MVLLSAISVISWVDRLIFTLLVAPIENALGLSDAQFGLLLGPAFVGVHLLATFPIAFALDRGRRKWILAAAVFLWCASTVAAAFTHDFTTLFLARSGVAIGEAALMPAAISLISDLFPAARRRVPTGVFMTVTILGATGAYLIGGGVIAWAEGLGVWNGLEPWRTALIAVGLLGMPMAALLTLTREPPRSDIPEAGASAAATWTHFRDHGPLYLCAFLGTGLLLMNVQASAAWLPTHLARGWQLEAAQTGALTAVSFAPTSALGVGLVTLLMGRRSGRAAVLRLLGLALVACGLATPFIFGVRSEALTPLLVTGALGMLGQGYVVTLNAMLIQTVTPGPMRARMMALFLTLMSLISSGIGPVAAATIATRFFEGPHALGGGLSVVAIAGIAGGAAFYLAALAWSRRQTFAAT